ncbi:beta strand repeat-containing protein [Marinicella meishanensis]|uniref:beta strand repeat-containing protein n=1 Tax=Marinicella meishanensis TaxID=2873263 RepID=UPI001CBB97CB|nr:cadherin domain-containing protein [Marinicella sp. NBU2979]
MMYRLVVSAFLVCTALFSVANAQNRFYHVYLDTDADAATGCVVNLPAFGTTVDGVENRLTITTDSSLPPVIISTQLHTCNAGVLDGGMPIPGAALGLNTGLGGADVFEAGVNQNNLDLTGSRRVLFYFHTDSDTAEDVVLTNGSGGPIALGFALPIPSLGWLALFGLVLLMWWFTRRHWSRSMAVGLVLVGVTGVAWAVTIMVDGLTGDWSTVNPANTDPQNDTTVNGSFADLTAVFVTKDTNQIYVRMDVVDLENNAPTITTPAAVSVQENQTAVIDVNATDPEGDVEGAGLTYSITGAIDDALFTIDVNTGVLSFISAPDFENPSDVDTDNVYNVQVTVTDSGAATDVQDLAVTVTNDVVDDTAVEFQAATSSTTDEGTALNVVVELTATAPLTAAVSVDVVDAGGGSATSGADYTAFGTQTVTFPLGATNGATMNVVLNPLNDTNVENNETVNLQMQNISGPALLGNQDTHTVTINEDDVATVEFDLAGSATSNESTPLDVAVRLNIPSGGQLDVAVSADAIDAGTGTATSGVDYTAFGTQTVTFAVGTGNGAIQNTTLTPLDDPNSKGNETVDLSLQNLVGPPAAALGGQTAHTVSITDDEAAVSFQTTSSATTDEGTALNVVVVLSTPIALTAPVSVDVVDAGGGTATSGSDYTAVGTQTITFPLGSTNGTTQNAVLTPLNDPDVENNETVNLALQNLVGTGSIGTQNAHTVTITEDDTATVAFQAPSSATANEATPLTVNVLLSIPSGGQLNVAVSVDAIDAGGGTATSGVDYNAFGTQVANFPIGATNGSTQATTLTPIDDPTSEGNETVNLALQNLVGPTSAALVAPTTHVATITDDEASVAFQTTSSATANEGSVLNPAVVLSTPIPLTAPLSVDVVDAGGGSATSGSDYTAIGTQTLTFPMGATNGTVQNASFIPVDDANVENNETVNLQLQNLVGTGSIGTQSTHTITITENDSATAEFQLAASASADESTALNIAVLLNIPSGGQLDVPITLDAIDAGGGTATSGVDYTAFGTQGVTFPIGSVNGNTQNVTLTPLDDPDTEGDETVNLQVQNLAGPVLASLGGQTTHTATISDDDNTAPTANADNYETIGNTGLHATAGAASTPIRHPNNVIFNDTDPELDPLTVIAAVGDVTAPFTGTSTLGGDVVMQANGDFTYYPPAGMTSMVDTFDYTISDGSLTSMSTVSITITSDLVYYVDNTAAPGGSGRDNSRFDQLSDVPTAANTTVYVLTGVGNTTGDLTLGASQILLGNGVNLEFNVNNTLPNPDVLFAAGPRPTLTGTTTLGTNNTVRGLNYGDTGANTGLLGNAFGTLTANNVSFTGTGKAIDLTNGTAAVTFDAVASTNSASEGIDLDGVTGNFTVTGLTNINNATGIGVNIQNSNLTYTFGDVTVNNRNSSGVFINAFTGGVQTGTFGNVTINNQNTSGTTAFGIDNAVTGGSTINVTSVAIDNNGANSSAIALSNNDGATINIAGGSVQGAAGAAVSISNSTGSATYAGSINNTAGRSVQVLSNGGGGTTTLSGNITDSGTGIFVNNNTGATVTFSGTLDLDTTVNTAFTATGGGTVNATGSGSTIDTTTAVAIDVQNTNIGAGNLTFQRVNAGTAAGTAGVGINLINTGAAGGLVVTGVGSTAGSGGLIRTKTGADVSTTAGIGIHLNNTQNVTLRNMQLNDFSNFAIRGFDVTNFSLIDSVINGINGTSIAQDEGAIRFTNLLGTSLFSGINVSGGIEDQIRINNNTGSATITFNDSPSDPAEIGFDAGGGTGNDGILVESQNAAVINLTIDGVTFLGARGDMIQTNVLGTSDFTALLQNNTFNNTHPNIAPGGGGITLSGGGGGANITQGYDVLASNFTGADGNATTVNYVNGAGTVSGAVSNNTIGTSGVVGSGSVNGNGISIGASANVQHNTTLNLNVVRRVGGFAGIETIANTNVNFNATITNNTVNELENFTFSALYNLLGGAGTETGTACLDIRNNTLDASTAPFGGNAVYKDQPSAAANFNLPGYAGSPNGEFAIACPVGTASANTNTHHAGNGNTMTNGPFTTIGGGVDATLVCGKTGVGTSCPQ